MKRVIFIEGPTAIGKSTYLEKMKEELSDSGLKVSTLSAKDFALAKDKSEDRKYTKYSSSSSKNSRIYKGHIELLKALQNELKEVDVVLVDRGFPSFVVYNLYSNPFTIGNSDRYISKYSKEVKKLLKGVSVELVIIRFKTSMSEAGIHTLVKRIEDRGDGKAIDKRWLTSLYYRYLGIELLLSDIYSDIRIEELE